MLRHLAQKIHAIAERVKRIGSYSLYLELSEIGCNVEKICSDSVVTENDLLGMSGLKSALPFMQRQANDSSEVARHV